MAIENIINDIKTLLKRSKLLRDTGACPNSTKTPFILQSIISSIRSLHPYDFFDSLRKKGEKEKRGSDHDNGCS
jgi:hypothetical protein